MLFSFVSYGERLKKKNHSVPHEVLTVKMKMNNILATGGLNEMEC